MNGMALHGVFCLMAVHSICSELHEKWYENVSIDEAESYLCIDP